MEGARVQGVLNTRRCQQALYAAGFGKAVMVRCQNSQDGAVGEFGVLGTHTIKAVKAFQKARGLEVTGSFDAPTRVALGIPVDA